MLFGSLRDQGANFSTSPGYMRFWGGADRPTETAQQESGSSSHFMKEVAYFPLCVTPHYLGECSSEPLRRSKENRSETHPPGKDATLTDGVLSF
jgi:hypothetical protein